MAATTTPAAVLAGSTVRFVPLGATRRVTLRVDAVAVVGPLVEFSGYRVRPNGSLGDRRRFDLVRPDAAVDVV